MTGDAAAVGSQPFLEMFQSGGGQPLYLGYKRFSRGGYILTAVILITGSVLIILEISNQTRSASTCGS